MTKRTADFIKGKERESLTNKTPRLNSVEVDDQLMKSTDMSATHTTSKALMVKKVTINLPTKSTVPSEGVAWALEVRPEVEEMVNEDNHLVWRPSKLSAECNIGFSGSSIKFGAEMERQERSSSRTRGKSRAKEPPSFYSFRKEVDINEWTKEHTYILVDPLQYRIRFASIYDIVWHQLQFLFVRKIVGIKEDGFKELGFHENKHEWFKELETILDINDSLTNTSGKSSDSHSLTKLHSLVQTIYSRSPINELQGEKENIICGACGVTLIDGEQVKYFTLNLKPKEHNLNWMKIANVFKAKRVVFGAGWLCDEYLGEKAPILTYGLCLSPLQIDLIAPDISYAFLGDLRRPIFSVEGYILLAQQKKTPEDVVIYLPLRYPRLNKGNSKEKATSKEIDEANFVGGLVRHLTFKSPLDDHLQISGYLWFS